MEAKTPDNKQTLDKLILLIRDFCSCTSCDFCAFCDEGACMFKKILGEVPYKYVENRKENENE